jgi:hypothetical protein
MARKSEIKIAAPSCAECRHFRDDDVSPHCVRYPPKPVWDGTKVDSVFPGTSPTNVCGEYSPPLND